MAILRGGRRIGGFDIRLGIPRDRSLENVENDPRFRQQAGGNRQSNLGRFQAYVNEAEGFARKARFYVEFQLPRSEGSPINPANASSYATGGDLYNGITVDGQNIASSSLQESQSFPSQAQMQSVQTSKQRRVNAFCTAIQMPERTMVNKEVRHHGPAFKPVFDFTTGEITATFMADKFLRERSYFEMWQSAIFSGDTFNYNFYDNYVSDLNIFQLGQYAGRGDRDDVTYAVLLKDCYPKTISSVEYSNDENIVQTFTVTFAFRNWLNYFLTKDGNFNVGKAEFADYEIKQTPMNGLLSKLPPELRRAGKDVIEGLKRRIPIGGITGGRVFPPFGNFPPLKL